MSFINYGPKKAPQRLIITESTQKVLENSGVTITEEETANEIVEKVKKSKKAVAKVKENGDIEVKQSLNG